MIENTREYRYDNLKCIMIFFVVFAHFLEILNGNVSNQIYIWIYTFHMPIFVYISGYFSKGSTKSIIKYVYIYLIWQTIFYLFEVIILKNKMNYNLVIPNWTLWYIFAMIFWNLFIKILNMKLLNRFIHNKKIYIIVVAFLASLLVGFFPAIGYKLSLSRIITFFPYFLLGYIHRNNNFKTINLKKIEKNIIIILAIISIVYFIRNNSIIKNIWLYGSYSYSAGGYTIVFKTMWIIFSIVQLYIIYNIIPTHKIKIISNIGGNTINIYLLHSLIIKWFKVYAFNIFCYSEIINILMMLIFTCIILLTLGNEFIKNKIIYLIDIYKLKEIFIKKIQ